MQPILKKLNYKNQNELIVINAPMSFYEALSSVEESASIIRDIELADEIDFIIAFVNSKHAIDELTPLITAKLKGDGTLWFAYQKKSKDLKKPEINRDHGWETLGLHGFEAVRQISINEAWSAVRFRKVEYIKKMIRKDGAISEVGKKRIENK